MTILVPTSTSAGTVPTKELWSTPEGKPIHDTDGTAIKARGRSTALRKNWPRLTLKGWPWKMLIVATGEAAGDDVLAAPVEAGLGGGVPEEGLLVGEEADEAGDPEDLPLEAAPGVEPEAAGLEGPAALDDTGSVVAVVGCTLDIGATVGTLLI